MAAANLRDSKTGRALEGSPSAGNDTVLDVSSVTVQFGGLVAVSDASLDVHAHEIVGLIGPNGAGKTTMFNAISGLNSPSSGTVRLFGEDVTSRDVHERAALGLGAETPPKRRPSKHPSSSPPSATSDPGPASFPVRRNAAVGCVVF